ncbi:hypothetical protein HK107_07810 [Parvularcula sp. ZS-1/3]|uniref:Uncharacterized protein n=1 Tax=Parvularcula mediterranea TaxID=2732508 RepID=A0A7Y3W575_9PROT|nr:hypothetical protein [Parvularcula mediterranea]NNU16223.1 hypothetical protein [Parvularcula mediterranea]
MTECTRFQFWLPKRDCFALEEAAKAHGIAPNQMAKKLVQLALSKDPLPPEKLADDLLVIRAGMEQLFRRSDRSGELDDAIEIVKTRLRQEASILRNGRIS